MLDMLNTFEAVLVWCLAIVAIVGVWHLCVWFATLIGLADDLGDEPSAASSRMAATWPHGTYPDIDRTGLSESSEPSVPVGFSPHRAIPDVSHLNRPSRIVATGRARGEYANTTGLRMIEKDGGA